MIVLYCVLTRQDMTSFQQWVISQLEFNLDQSDFTVGGAMRHGTAEIYVIDLQNAI